MALDKEQAPRGFESNKDPIYDSEKNSKHGSGDLESRGPASNFGQHGGRIGPVLKHLRGTTDLTGSGSDANILAGQIEAESENAIQYRTCSWYKTAALLFSEYICLAIMSFPYSYSVLGLVPGLILTVVIAAFVLYTSLVVWEFCLRHPEVRDVCDIGQMLFWGKTWAWYATAVMFLLNNTFIQGLHVLVFAKYLNTITNHSQCTIVFAVIAALICWLCSLPRTFSALAKLATVSAFFTFISVLLAAIFAGIEAHPAGYNPDPSFVDPTTGIHGGEPIVTAIPLAGTTFVAGMSAFLNISYTFIGQITIPSFIAEMKEPKDFPKALWAVTIAEVLVFGIIGSVVYAYTGNQYNTAPAFGSLGNELFKKVSFSFMIPTLIFLGVLYASVSARFVFFRIFEGTKHKSSHTVVGWAAWAGILAATWVGAFIIAEVIPFFSDLLSVMSSLFDSFFGFIFWGLAYIRMRRVDGGVTWISDMSIYGYLMLALNLFIIAIGVFFLSAGTYASVQSIIDSYAAGAVGGVFTCASNGL
ncbi:N amino acid transport system protein [Lachnellula occidentalis]|uniref:N amino acid transport system protein n=1 Tax=Lachnellula occidentalis TaxID=215460 RepID=A0A8H8S732_9HELO|nr:N amino acid transport system protein [Lachnellula occidentalis]